jgi:hypothetical protein
MKKKIRTNSNRCRSNLGTRVGGASGNVFYCGCWPALTPLHIKSGSFPEYGDSVDEKGGSLWK